MREDILRQYSEITTGVHHTVLRMREGGTLPPLVEARALVALDRIRGELDQVGSTIEAALKSKPIDGA